MESKWTTKWGIFGTRLTDHFAYQVRWYETEEQVPELADNMIAFGWDITVCQRA